MKRVIPKVAKAIKEAGFPIEVKSIEEAEKLGWKKNEAFFTGMCSCALCPYVMTVWLWLWQEKWIKIVPEPRVSVNENKNNVVDVYIVAPFYALPHTMGKFYTNPEDAIISAIEFLTENNLIK